MRMILAVLFLFCVSSGAYAHPPSGIKVTFTKDTVEITVEHPVRDPADHYIKTVVLRRGLEIVAKQDFTKQQGGALFASLPRGGIQPDDQVSVEAFCSKFGSKRVDVVAQ